ncbi:hypothetical protein BU23DRAFT_476798 [Bimuria novae-zelandiae CBS 107.79]|uniref:Mid2 domain-containing protein n=1 Tax=Bimuria novae-zelandiae CBS 107.79 TaxID=1447943 RepID=A0A6A5UXP9_9PLEO|nr:hypothetical protein BU23DRAFT_476798 [Bimuria novae-zelandiae CBS 107.79]
MFLIDCLFILSIATASYATTSHAIICGYRDGDPQSPRTAQPGYECRVDTANGLWGFCAATVISARDCGLAGVCVDSRSCTEGCGRLFDRADITTFSCERSQFCSTVLLINGPDQSFEYIACGAEGRTDRLFPVPNTAEATATSSRSTSVPSNSLTNSASQPTATVVQTTSVPISTSSSVTISSSVSSASGSIPTSSKQEPMNLGAIVGGAIGALTVICLTILGIVLIRRKHGVKGQAMSPPDHTHHGRNEFVDDATLHAHNSGDAQKNYHWDSSHGLVEMYSGHHVNMEPVELSGQVQCTGTPKETT